MTSNLNRREFTARASSIAILGLSKQENVLQALSPRQKAAIFLGQSPQYQSPIVQKFLQLTLGNARGNKGKTVGDLHTTLGADEEAIFSLLDANSIEILYRSGINIPQMVRDQYADIVGVQEYMKHGQTPLYLDEDTTPSDIFDCDFLLGDAKDALDSAIQESPLKETVLHECVDIEGEVHTAFFDETHINAIATELRNPQSKFRQCWHAHFESAVKASIQNWEDITGQFNRQRKAEMMNRKRPNQAAQLIITQILQPMHALLSQINYQMTHQERKAD